MRDTTRAKLAKIQQQVLELSQEVTLLTQGQTITADELVSLKRSVHQMERSSFYITEALESKS